MTAVDISLFVTYLLVVFAIGWYVRRGSLNKDSFYTAGRSMHWFPVGISVMITAFSSINFMAFPSEVFKNGLYVLIALPVFILVIYPLTRWIIPNLYNRSIVSVYEILEEKYDVRVRILASSFFILWRITWMAVALYAAGRILQATLGFPMEIVIIAAGVIATLYTAVGGMRSVMMTDTLQFFVLFGGIVVAVAYALTFHGGGIAGALSDLVSGGKLMPVAPFDPQFFSLDPTMRISFWSGIIGTMVAFITRYSSDQVVVQRYFTASSMADVRKALWLNGAVAIGALLLLALFGLAIYSYAVQNGSIQKGLPPLKYMGMMLKAMPVGVAGLVASGLMAATMSSVDSGVHSCVTVWSVDFRRRLMGVEPGRRELSTITILLGGTITLLALMLISLLGPHQSIFKMINVLINGLGAPLCAIMLLGMFSKWCSSNGVFVGGVLGFIGSVVVLTQVEVLALHYYGALNFMVTLMLCYVCSYLIPQKTKMVL
ncbi:MAG: sodium/solute symporter [Fibrobacterales bacterium]